MKKGVVAATVAVLAIVLIAVFVMMGNKKDTEDTSSSNSSGTNQSTSDNDSDNTQPAGQAGAVETDKVGINDMAFEFDEIKVKKGTTVTWTNNDGVPHNVTGTDANGPKSDTLQTGDTYSFTFNEVGTFTYRCTFHSGMTAKVTVVE